MDSGSHRVHSYISSQNMTRIKKQKINHVEDSMFRRHDTVSEEVSTFFYRKDHEKYSKPCRRKQQIYATGYF
jgi:hypothetical protein